MTTKNDINRMFAEIMEYVKDSTKQSVLTTIQQSDNQTALLNNVSKTIDQSITQAYNNASARLQTQLNNLEESITATANKVPAKRSGRSTRAKK